MVHYQRYHQWRKGEVHSFEDEESHGLVMGCASSGYYRRKRPKLFYLLVISLLSCSFVLTPHLFGCSAFSLLYSFGVENEASLGNLDSNAPLCSSMSAGTICCDRSSIRSDICIMKGDIRTSSSSSSVFLYASSNSSSSIKDGRTDSENDEEIQHEKIKPYSRKWETSTMDTIDELNLVVKKGVGSGDHGCDVYHDVPAVFFSTGGYTGNLYHEFNDGILPLYITSQHFKKRVVFVILEYHNWWIMKYGDILSRLTDYPPIDYTGDKRTHCFSEAIVGLKIHDELTVDPSRMKGNKTIVDFRNLLDRAYWPRIRDLMHDEEREMKENLTKSTPSPSSSELSLKSFNNHQELQKPKMLILARNGSRAILNEASLVKMAEAIGFRVEILRPERTTELAKIYRTLNSSDVMVGVHGAAMTHFLFLKPGCWFIQVIPLGTDWAADTYYGEPARKLGLRYIGYKILPRESSLYQGYNRDDPVLMDPDSVNNKGWQYTKKIYLDSQNVTLDLRRFRKRLVRAYSHYMKTVHGHGDVQSQ